MGRKTRAFLAKLGKAINKTDKLIKEHKAEKAKKATAVAKAGNIKIGKPISGIQPKKPVATPKAVPSGKPV